MKVKNLLDVINNLPDDYEGFGISDVDSWRGVYAEPAFEFSCMTTKTSMLKVMDKCMNNLFTGYKGGEFYYEEDSNVNFDTYGNYTDGGYFESSMEGRDGNLFAESLIDAYLPK